MNEWVSIKDRLPEEHKKVLIYMGGSFFEVAFMQPPWRKRYREWICVGQLIKFEMVTHWMKLIPPVDLKNE